MTSTILSLLSATTIADYTARGFWRDETIWAIAAGHAARMPERIAVRDRHRALDWRTLLAAADALAADLAQRGVRPGQRVALWMPDRIESVVAVLACSRNGHVISPSPHRNHTVAEVAELLARMRAAALIYQDGFGADGGARDIGAAIADLGCVRHLYRLDGPDARPPFAGRLLAAAAAPPPPSADPNRVGYLAFTSGSTGRPRGVMHSENTLLLTARAIARDWRIGPGSVVYSLSPLSHNLGTGTLITAIVGGAEIVIHDRGRGESLVDRLVESGATYLVGVPTHAIDLLAEMRARGLDRLGRVTAFRVSGAASPPGLLQELLDRGIEPQSGYGMTETNAHQYTRPGDDPALITGTCGRACAGYALVVVDPDEPDRILPPGATGLVAGRGASLMLGYFDDQIASESAFNAGGWFLTGDLGTIDDRGYLRLTGRKKEVIIRGGHNINPARIEELALHHDAVARAAAVPVVDPRLGERVCLALMWKDGHAAPARAVLDHLAAAGLSRYEMPEFTLELAEIPLMANGKIQKLDIVRWIADGTVVPVAVAAER